MDILLIQPPIQDFYLTAKRTIPYGLAAIAACLEQAGFSVGILDGLATSKSRPMAHPPEMSYLDDFYGRPDISPFCLFHGYRHFGYSYEHLEKMIRESGAFLVGISSLFTAYSKEAEKVSEIARAALPNAAIVVGGHHPTALPEEVMKWRSVDYAIRGEGETAFLLLADLIRNGRDPSHVPGIVFRKPQGGFHISPAAVMEDLDAVPLPARHLINNRFYTRSRSPSTVIVTSRGCPLRCSYCALGNGDLYPYRQRSVSSVLCEIQNAVENFGARFIDFEDENLSFSKKWFLTLLEGIVEKFGAQTLELRAMNGLYPPTLDETVVKAMAAAGFKTLNLSLGSTCSEQLRRFRRPDVRAAFDECLLLAEESDLDAVGYVICGAPNQDAGKSMGDLIYLAQRRVLAGLSVFYPAPGSKDFQTASALHILPKSHTLFRSSTIPLSQITTRIQAITLMRLARLVNFMKQIIDGGKMLPEPVRNIEENIPQFPDRFRMGEYLLSGFLADGSIRGLTPDHRIYRHRIDENLAADFIVGLKPISVKGAGRR